MNYIERLMMTGYNACQAWNIFQSFAKEQDFDGLDGFIELMERDRKCLECPFGKSTTIILLEDEESGIVPSER